MNTTVMKDADLGSFSQVVTVVMKRFGNWLSVSSIILIMIFGWLQKDEYYLEAETGLGYALGIIGGSLMLLLLIYPLRKRLKSLGRVLSVKFWFRLHMTFGILGPLAILFHSNFSLGSTNSNVALICMLLVAASGVVGRYLYVWIHHGLYGSRIELTEFKVPTEEKREVLGKYLPGGDKIIETIEQIQKTAMVPATGYLHSLKMRRLTKKQTTTLRKQIRNAIREDRKTSKNLSNKVIKLIRVNLKQYTEAVKKTSDFRVHEQMFALWHVLHLPLFIMMIVSGTVHVVVVHMY